MELCVGNLNLAWLGGSSSGFDKAYSCVQTVTDQLHDSTTNSGQGYAGLGRTSFCGLAWESSNGGDGLGTKNSRREDKSQ